MGEDTALSDADRSIVDKVDDYLERGLEVYRWQQRAAARGTYAERFQMFDQFERPDTNYGFIDETTVGGKPFPVVGTVQEVLYDRPKEPPKATVAQRARDAEEMRRQIRAYMLRYFMRVASHRAPQLTATKPEKEPPEWLRPFSWGVGGPLERRGWGYKQLYYKRRGRVGKFPASKQRAIVDVTEVGKEYDWIVLEVNVFDFALTLPPFSTGPQLSLPAKSIVHVVLSPEFVIDRKDPEDGILGRYGWGYAFIKPETTGSLLGYGPDALGPAFMSFHFDVHEDGRARLSNSFAANQPTQLVNISLNPVDWGVEVASLASFGLARPLLRPVQEAFRRLPGGRARLRPIFGFIEIANLLTGGLAKRELSISRSQLLKEVMAIHFLDTYHFALDTIETWNQIPDWTADDLPAWVVEGRSS